MKVLVACEYSGIVRDAFIARGHDAMSCDLLPTESPGPHYQGDVMEIINDGWDMMIAHPPCTFLCSSGLHWNKRRPGRERDGKISGIRAASFGCSYCKNSVRKPYRMYFIESEKTGSGYTALAIRTRRKQGDLFMVKESSIIKANRLCGMEKI